MTGRSTHNPQTPEPTLADPAAWAQARLRRQVMVLEDLSDTGLRLAQAVERQAAEPAASPADIAMAFSRVARAVRMTALLQSRLIRELGQMHEAVAAEAQEHEARQDPAYRHKARVEAVVERVARDGGHDEETLDRMIIEAGDRLNDDDIYGDVLTRPVGELVSLICRDLGLDPDWSRLAQEAWAQEERASGVEGSPFHNLPRSRQRAAGGGPPAEERGVEGAGHISPAFSAPPDQHLHPTG